LLEKWYWIMHQCAIEEAIVKIWFEVINKMAYVRI
jgi:hypothetical protein